MKLALTPDMLAAAYDYLRTMPPYRGWKLPESDAIEFKVLITKHRGGHFRGENRPGAGHEIAVSMGGITDYGYILEVLAHEMIHMHQDLQGVDGIKHHDAAFNKIASRVCRIHGFDPKTF